MSRFSPTLKHYQIKKSDCALIGKSQLILYNIYFCSLEKFFMTDIL